MMRTFFRTYFLYISHTICAIILFFLNSWSLANESPIAIPSTISQDQQILLENKKYQQGLKALYNHLPLEACKHFQECLNTKSLSASQKLIVRPFLAEALIRAKKTEEGLAIWKELPDSSMKSYWMAIGFLDKGSFTESLKYLSSIPDSDNLAIFSYQVKAQLARHLQDYQLLLESLNKLKQAEVQDISLTAHVLLINVLINLNHTQEATELLEQFKTEKENTLENNLHIRSYTELLEGKLANKQNNLELAIKIFTSVMDNKSYPEKIRDLSRLALAKAEIAREKNDPEYSEKETRNQSQEEENQHTAGTAEERLLTFIGTKSESPLLIDAFNILLAEKTFQNNPQAWEKLNGWIKTKDSFRQPAAIYAMGNLLLSKDDLTEATSLLDEGISKHPQSITIQTLATNTITKLLEKGRIKEAERLISKYPGTSPDLTFQQGALAFHKGNYSLAQKFFNDASQQTSDPTAERAIFNENLAALNSNNTTRVNELIKESAKSDTLREQILFEQAHYAAKRMDPKAAELLARFIALSKNPVLKIQALLEQAEVALNLNPPDIETSQSVLNQLKTEQLSQAQSMHLARLNILEAECQQEWTTAIQACRHAITQDTTGQYADKLNLKLGELLYKNGDFHEALLVLQPFPSHYPNSPLQASALFLAGKAAQQSNTSNSLKTALTIFQTLGSQNTPFTRPAKIEEASILLRMGKSEQCIATLETLLNSQLPRYMRLLALSIQADAWVTKEDANSDSLHKAINLCSEILGTPNLGLAWKFKALTQRAQFYERINEQKRALDDYASILAYTPNGSSANKRKDWHWFYNAGFASIRLLGQLQNWDSALALAEKLAQTSGPRAREAAAYARRIRLEHFIWQNESETSSHLRFNSSSIPSKQEN